MSYTLDQSPDLLPLRMLNEYAYCPRLFHLMHVEGRWEDNAYTVDGRHVHRRIDNLDHLLPEAGETTPTAAATTTPGKGKPRKDAAPQAGAAASAVAGAGPPNAGGSPNAAGATAGTSAPAAAKGDDPPVVSRSVPLSSEILGISAKLDLVATDGDDAMPVETKRGRVPENEERSWEPERVQLMAQGLLLRENGYQCDHGMLYSAGSRTRVRVDFTPQLESRTRELLKLAKAAALSTVIPDPLDDSPKCRGCSLAGICLPDETLALRRLGRESSSSGHENHFARRETPSNLRDKPSAGQAIPPAGRDKPSTANAMPSEYGSAGPRAGRPPPLPSLQGQRSPPLTLDDFLEPPPGDVADAALAPPEESAREGKAHNRDVPGRRDPDERHADQGEPQGEPDQNRQPVPGTAPIVATAFDAATAPVGIDAIADTDTAGDGRPPGKPRAGSGDEYGPMVRRLYPPRPDALPLYVQTQGAFVGKKGESLIVKADGEELTRAGIKDVSQLVLCGNVQVSTQTLHLLCESDIPVVMLSSGMWFYGITHGQSLKNAYDRAAQFHAAADPARCLAFAKALVRDKAMNQKTQLRRNAPPSKELDRTLADIDDLVPRIATAPAIDVLLGLEGNVARCYFGRFSTTLKPRDFDAEWDFNSRNRRPPKDPVNAMLSFAYAMLVKECTVALLAEGLDPYWGLYHRPRHGRPAMALDLMEPFRPIVADSAVITAINTGMVRGAHFTRAASGCAMDDQGRKGLLRAYEARLEQLVTHPVFDYRCSWRSVIRLQARLFARWLRGDVPDYTNLVTR